MFLKKVAYWCAGFVSFYLLYITLFYFSHDFSLYSRARPRPFSVQIKSNLQNFYLACHAYWADTDPTQTCTPDNLSPVSHGYIPSEKVVIWVEQGAKTDFSALGKHRDSEIVFKTDPTGNTRELQDKELEAAQRSLKK